MGTLWNTYAFYIHYADIDEFDPTKHELRRVPHHLLSAIWCFLFIIIITLGLFDKLLYKVLSILVGVIAAGALAFFGLWDQNQNFETYRTIDLSEIPLVGEVNVTYFAGTQSGDVTVIHPDDNTYSLKLTGKMYGEYEFTLTDANDKEYNFKYSYSDESKSVELKQVK